MATTAPLAMHSETRRLFQQIAQHAAYLRAHSTDSTTNSTTNSAAVSITTLIGQLEARLGDVGDAMDWKLHSVAYDAVDAAIDARDTPIRHDGYTQPRQVDRT